MKRVLFATLTTLALSVSATEVNLNDIRDYSDRTGYDATVGKKFGKFGVEVDYNRFAQIANYQDRYSLVGSYDIAKVNSVTLAVKGGAAYLNNQTSSNGYALTAGVGASVPVYENLAATFDYRRQEGQNRISPFDGNQFAIGLRHSFK
jgi:outer membrane autotransporter protein